MAATVLASLETFIQSVPDWSAALRGPLSRALSTRIKLQREAEMLDSRIDRLFDALEKGIKMDWERLRQLQDRRDEIRAMPQIPDIEASHFDVLTKLQGSIDAARAEWDNRKYASPIRNLLHMTVHKIVCTPIDGQRCGETVDVQLKPVHEWGEYYAHIHAHWPHVGSDSSSRQAGQHRSQSTISPINH